MTLLRKQDFTDEQVTMSPEGTSWSRVTGVLVERGHWTQPRAQEEAPGRWERGREQAGPERTGGA